ncbi:hypothetical protein HK098_005752 [Nowakowskiella sp. JEL0407]|nr:hypothetical protein HK098_005752 [Nowakowskiella sp. JEL0407]
MAHPFHDRLLFLEALVGDAASPKALDLSAISKKLAFLNDFVKAYKPLKSSLSANSILNDSSLIDASTKKEIVLSSENSLSLLTEQLQEIEVLKDYVDKLPDKNSERNYSALMRLQKQYHQQNGAISELREKVLLQTDEYNEFVDKISQLFIFLDSQMTALEHHVANLENSR